MIACPEEIAHGRGWIDDDALRVQAEALAKTAYGQYLKGLLEQGEVRKVITREPNLVNIVVA